MNVSIKTYHEFTIYSFIQLYIHTVFAFVLEKLYFEGREKLANKYCLTMSLLNFSVLMLSAILFKNYWTIITITLISIFSYVCLITLKEYRKFKFVWTIDKNIKYESLMIFKSILFLLIFLFGLSNVYSYASEYAVALNFVTLITDTQWDAYGAISTVAKVDISKKNFNYWEHIKNAYRLLIILLITVFLMMFVSLYFYELNFGLMFAYLSFELFNFIIYPVYSIRTCYLQLEYSQVVATSNNIFSNTLRFFISKLPTPFCTVTGQATSSLYQLISTSIIFNKHYKVNKEGIVEQRV